jgi:5-methylcytosine-specific restriction protein B
VGAAYGGSDDQLPRFLEEGIWQTGNQERFSDELKAMQPGDRIAVKSTYTRKYKLPFDNRGHAVSVMAIKAIGIIKENPGDGQLVKVDWTSIDPPREWYFYTYRATIWRVLPGDWTTDALIGFTFDGKSQDLERFRNAPYWKVRFGDIATENLQFLWTRFYEAIAIKILDYRTNRKPLIEAIHAMAARVSGITILQDRLADGTTEPLKDVCPFTIMGLFNRRITDANRKTIAAELASFLGVTERVPHSFEGIPILNNQNSWFFGFKGDRRDDDIDALWKVFEVAVRFADSDDADTRPDFISAYDDAAGRYNVKWNLTMGLYWIRPWTFPTLDGQSRPYISTRLNLIIGSSGPKGACSGSEYMALLDALETRFREPAFPVHSFPELSLAAWGSGIAEPPPTDDDGGNLTIDEPPVVVPPLVRPYSIENIMQDGCFLESAQLGFILKRLGEKKNLVLQGPPGTGKTWLAKRLAFAFMGQCNESRVRMVQFHPNLSYEDFVRGYRPSAEGKLDLIDGPFLEMVTRALGAPSERHVIVIEEINRGNPAQIFGEMLTLLEADKRTPDEALELCYRRTDGERVFVPDNLYLIGTMNIADRSLALVDLALRRRFAFIDLEPLIGEPWRRWVREKNRIDDSILEDIEKRMLALNTVIMADASLGPQFRLGHSYVTPSFPQPIEDGRAWFRCIVETEIGPQLDEYWFDAPDKARNAKARLLEGL